MGNAAPRGGWRYTDMEEALEAGMKEKTKQFEAQGKQLYPKV
jgi:hypothetical protein